jgi:hypothetical protein
MVVITMNAMFRLVISILVVLWAPGCSSAPRKFYPGPVLPAESLAVLMTHSPSAYLQRIRGNGVDVGIHPRDGVPMHWAGDAIEIPPGEYTVILGPRSGLFETRTWKITKQLEAGHRYSPQVRGSKPEWFGTVDEIAR